VEYFYKGIKLRATYYWQKECCYTPGIFKKPSSSFVLKLIKGKFVESIIMALSVEDLDDQIKYRQILVIPYAELVVFILDYIRRRSALMVFFWSVCIIFFGIAFTIRTNIAGYFPIKNILFHSFLGLILFPVICIPVHESLHIIPYFISGARKIRVGMDLNQYMFYVTAHRHVATPIQFRIVAIIPFFIISLALLFLTFSLPGLWKWSTSLFLFVHATMCAGDFALLNFYWLNRKKKIYTWDDADQKVAYFYEELK
jgi:Putative zincin peptidase